MRATSTTIGSTKWLKLSLIVASSSLGSVGIGLISWAAGFEVDFPKKRADVENGRQNGADDDFKI